MTTEPEYLEDDDDTEYDPWEDHECGRDCYGDSWDEEDEDDDDDEG